MDIKEQYEDDGFAVIPGVFGWGEICKMRAAAFSTLMHAHPNNAYRAGGRMLLDSNGGPALMFWPALRNDLLNRIRCSNRLGAIVRKFLPQQKQKI